MDTFFIGWPSTAHTYVHSMNTTHTHVLCTGMCCGFVIFLIHPYACSSCLRSWLEQDTSCPTCRMSLNINEGVREGGVGQRPPAEDNMAAGPGNDVRPHLNQHNHFFHFDGMSSSYRIILDKSCSGIFKHVCSVVSSCLKQILVLGGWGGGG